MTLSLTIATMVVVLALASIGYFACALAFVRRPKSRTSPVVRYDVPVTVLVPARNEGQGALRALESILAQDYPGPIRAVLIVRDATDTSVGCLAARYPGVALDNPPPHDHLVHESPGSPEAPPRSLHLAFAGSDPKSDKVNWAVQRVETELVAILDADHQADVDWLTSAVSLLLSRNVDLVQGRRRPLSVQGVFALWDSLHQHVGCELFDAAYSRLGLPVFFTGTTAVMRTDLLRQHGLGASITEDTDFSYRAMLLGASIVHDPWAGSREETSPDLYSFLARRRRWANGHSATLLRQWSAIWRTDTGLLRKVQYLFHGMHYLLGAGVFALHLALGIAVGDRLSTTALLTGTALGTALAHRVARTQRTQGWGARLTDFVVLLGWFVPALLLGLDLVGSLLWGYPLRGAIPVPASLQALSLAGLLAPLALLLTGMAGFGQLTPTNLLAVASTYPIAFYFDLAGVLLGLGDLATGRADWRPVARAPLPSVVLAGRSQPPGSMRELRDIWRLRFSAPPWSLGTLMKKATWSKLSRAGFLVLLIFPAAWVLLREPPRHFEVAPRNCQALDHDTDPWIVPAWKLPDYCRPVSSVRTAPKALRTGSYRPLRDESLQTLDPTTWEKLDSTFFCNLAHFKPEHATLAPGGGLQLSLQQDTSVAKGYSSGSIGTKDGPDGRFLYGRFEAQLRPARASGVISAMFLYRFDPWQEIDIEFPGKDTTKLLANVFYNPGEEGDKYNYGFRGTPVLIDLGFDAAEAFHTYAIEWEPEEVRWLVDGEVVHVRHALRPTPIPHLPMRFFVNLWPCCSEQIAGPFVPLSQPVVAEWEHLRIDSWVPSPLDRAKGTLGRLLGLHERGDWRQQTSWLQKGPEAP